MNLYIDFVNIGDEEDFFHQLKTKLNLSENLEDTIDMLTAYLSKNVELLHVEFVNMSVEQLDIFDELLMFLEDLEEKYDNFTFAYFLEQYEDEE